MVFTDAEIAYLKSQRLGRLATVRPDGQPQASPVGFAWNPATSTIDIAGWQMARSWKFRNLAANDRVAFVVDDIASLEPWTVRGIEVRGRAEALTDAADAAIVLGDRAIIRIHPGRVISWGVDESVPRWRDVTP